MEFDIGLLRGVITAVLFALFVSLVAWAYSGRRSEVFERMGRLPLEEDGSREP